MDRRMKEELDRYITGNYGENQFEGEDPEEEDRFIDGIEAKVLLAYNGQPHTFTPEEAEELLAVWRQTYPQAKS